MLSKEEATDIAQRALETAPAQCSVLVESRRLDLTRYAGNEIHQTMSEDDDVLYVTLLEDGRRASGWSNKLEDSSVRQVMETARAALRAAEAQEGRRIPAKQTYPEVHPFEATTALWSADQRADAVCSVVEQAKSAGLSASGAFYTEVKQAVIAASSGLEACEARTASGLTAIVQGKQAAGYGADYSRDASRINPLDVGETAVSKALLGSNPRGLDAGEYEVVLEQQAVADLLAYLAWSGFSARTVEEGRSFMSGRFGEEVTGSNVTITEDPLSPEGYYSAVDYEGMPRRVVPIIAGGRVGGPVYDLETAARAGVESTGHAAHPLDQEWFPGPMTSSLSMAAGDADLEDLIASVKRGLLITRFHYVNIVHPMKTVLTGLTRDGTFLIENGLITGAVGDMRFTDSVLAAFTGVEAATRQRKLILGEGGMAVVAPAIKLSRLRFTGSAVRA